MLDGAEQGRAGAERRILPYCRDEGQLRRYIWNGGTLTITNTETNAAVATSTGPENSCKYGNEDSCERTETACLPCGSYSAQQAGSSYNEEVSWLIWDPEGSTVAEASGTDSAAFSRVCASCTLGSGSVSETECETCPEGKYSDVDGVGLCTGCEAGRYSRTTGATSSDFCLECEAGKYSPEGSSSETTCIRFSHFWDFRGCSGNSVVDAAEGR